MSKVARLTSKERISRILKHQPVDRVGLFEVFWRETVGPLVRRGQIPPTPEDVSDHFGLDVRRTSGEITPMPGQRAGARGRPRRRRDGRRGNGHGEARAGRQRRPPALAEERLGRTRARGFRRARPRGLGRAHPAAPCTTTAPTSGASASTATGSCGRNARGTPVFLTCGVVGAFDLHVADVRARIPARWAWRSTGRGCANGRPVRRRHHPAPGEALRPGRPPGRALGLGRPGLQEHALHVPRDVPARSCFPRTSGCSISRTAEGCPWSCTATASWKRLLPALIEAGIDCLQPIETQGGHGPAEAQEGRRRTGSR